MAQAQAGVDALVAQRDMLTLRAAQDGTVLDVVLHRGEVAAAGATLLTLADLTEATLTVYVPEDRLGDVFVGQEAQISVDSFPGRVFTGTVKRIGASAEYTPRNVATQDERSNLVFAVEVRVANGDGSLMPGMPADAFLAAGPDSSAAAEEAVQ